MVQLRFVLFSVSVALALFVAIVLFIEVGRRIALLRAKKRGTTGSVGIVDSAVYGLFALLVGFTFSGAAARFDSRRALIADEANAASTSWQRIDLLPAQQQLVIRDALRRYMDALISWYTASEDPNAMFNPPPALIRAQNELWGRSVNACTTTGGEAARMLLLPSLNELFDLVDKERMARRMHPPRVIWAMLGLTALTSALFAGYALSGSPRNWLYITGLAASVSVATFVILELEFPRLGLARVTSTDRLLVELRASLE